MDGILITIPARFFKEYPGGEAQFHKIMERMNDERASIIWGNTIANIPKRKVLYCYLVFLGKVQYRLNIIDYEKNVSKEFNDGGLIRVFKNKNWVNLSAPVVKSPCELPMKGFQGFRYTFKLNPQF